MKSICQGAIDGVEEVVPQHLKTNHACQTQSSEIPAKLKTAGDSLLTSGQACTSKNTCVFSNPDTDRYNNCFVLIVQRLVSRCRINNSQPLVCKVAILMTVQTAPIRPSVP